MCDVLLLAMLLLVGTSAAAFAYIDPGSASVVITAVLGFFGAISYTMRRAVTGFRSRLSGKANASHGTDVAGRGSD